MATDKRSLYKRATQDAVVPKDRRKTLAQGRLVTNLTATGLTTQKDDKQFGEEAFAADQDLDSNIGNKNTVAVKKCLSGPVHSITEPGRGNGLPEEMDVENSTTPRKMAPQILPRDPSDVAQPTASLDLSETEDEKNELKDLKDSNAPEVIVVDANRKLITLNDAEVDISLHYAHSPAKVIRHTPNRIHGDIRNTGSVERAACLSFDKVPSAVIVDDEEAASTQQKQNTSIHKVPTVIREAAIVGHSVDPKSISLTSSLLTNSSLMTKSASVNETTAKSLEKISASHLEAESSDQVSEFSENDSLSSKDKSNSLSNKAKARGLTSIEAVSNRQTENRKASRIVPSRYLQAASNSKGPIKATDKTFLGSGSGVLPGSIHSQRRYNSNSLNRTRRSKPTLKKHGSDADLSNCTPHPKAGQFGVSASTPNADETSCFIASNVDVSAIAALPASNRIGHLQQNAPADMSADLSRIGFPEFDSRLASHPQTKKRSVGEISQWDLELLYARHLQWAFLASKARKTLHEQEKQAMEQLCSLAELNKSQDDKIAELESELERLRHTNNVDEALDMQYSGLSCSTSKLPQLREQHHHLAEALDTTRHHIPTKGIYIPDNDVPYLDAIARALQESEHLLGEISVMTRTQTKDIDQCGKVLQAMENVIAHEKSELNRCNVLLSAAVTLATQENSLMVQHIQSNQESQDA